MTQRTQNTRTTSKLAGGVSRRELGAGMASLALASSKALAAGDDHPTVVPRMSMKPPVSFTFKINGPAQRMGMSTERLKRVHEFIQRKIDAGVLSGAVTAIARRGEMVHYEAHGYANIETKQPMPLDALFRMASSSKPVTAVSLLMMLEEGRLRLQDPVSKFIPEFGHAKVAVLKPGQPARRASGGLPREVDLVPLNRPLTILDLATHTGGLLSQGGLGTEVSTIQRDSRGAEDTLASFIPRLASAPLDFQPGTRWQYAGAGTDTLGRIVEIVSGTDLSTFFHTRIFEPLGMNDTYFNVPAEKIARLLPQQRKVSGKWELTPNSPNVRPTKFFSGAGGLMSTCHDYLAFEQMLLNRGELNSKRLLGSRTVELMGTNLIGDLYKGPANDHPGHGFGVQVRIVMDAALSDTGRSNGAFGWDGAFGTMSWNDKAEEMSAVIMLQQRDRDTMWGYERMIRQAIID